MTRQYLSGEMSVLLGHLQAAATTESSRLAAWSLRHAVETEPVSALDRVLIRSLRLSDRLCWGSLNRGDIAAFNRQAAVCAELREFGASAGLLTDT